MSKVSHEEFIAKYLPNGKVLQLATISGNGPWICTVNYVNDKDGNIYWISMKNRRHSIEVEGNSQSAIAIVLDPDKKVGLQLTGVSSQVKDEDLEKAHNLYSLKFGDKPERLAGARDPSSDGRTYYMFTPKSIKVHDEVTFPTDPQQVVDVS